MEVKEYLEKEEVYLRTLLKTADAVQGSEFRDSVIRNTALEMRKKLDYMVLVDDGSTDTAGASVDELYIEEVGWVKSLLSEYFDEHSETEVIGRHSFLPLLFSEYTLSKNHISY